jgi:fatty-acyl-CoA synthase
LLGETDGEADPNKVLAAGETGIVALRGPNVSAGYSDPARNAGTFLPGGWLVSGDLGKLDAEGRLFITGRKKDIIIRGAHNIDPQMIEDALLSHPEVTMAAAVGMPDAYAGELPVAFATLRPGSELTEAELTAFLKEEIDDPVAMPKRIGLRTELPVTPVGKVFKPALRRDAIHWAIDAVACQLGLQAKDISVSVAETLETEITAPTDAQAALREKMTGMPITVDFITKDAS